ncbi:nicotinate-nucleotide adenylyltransferase [Aquibacillus salsiterrae]|uniref:Probable nicotinate-nucleotide adenylyltransferase n=1 Tax=Aquibacillus salsiterrae TaxID=2950439 RepID=A0A9X3WDT0_9BACI|nr:nicotinate-nucleotide adenylyltransferase [Aquibacillus salsiterrae]MDC3415589.1 nicotinate-nucleotide adenylyltransferase [Aquibacillus salsiterrae]
MKKVGILGGTFDPPHYGHLLIAEEVYQALKLDEVWFIPSYEPPHKEKATSTVEKRLAMLEVAIDNNEHFSINKIEVNRSVKSYTINTIYQLNEQHPDMEFYFIIGADMVEYLPHWYRIDELMQLVKFVGVKRPDYTLKTNYPIIEVEVPALEISSTEIRQRLQQGKSIRYLVPDGVLAVIKENQLYG